MENAYAKAWAILVYWPWTEDSGMGLIRSGLCDVRQKWSKWRDGGMEGWTF